MDTLRLSLIFAFWLLLLLAHPVTAAENTEHYTKAVVLWQAEDPTCFTSNLPLHQQMAEIPTFSKHGQYSEPRKKSGPKLSLDKLEGIQPANGIPVPELVINKEGNVESVVALRPTNSELDKRLAEMYRAWTFDPSSNGESPVCVIYIVVTHIHWQ